MSGNIPCTLSVGGRVDTSESPSLVSSSVYTGSFLFSVTLLCGSQSLGGSESPASETPIVFCAPLSPFQLCKASASLDLGLGLRLGRNFSLGESGSSAAMYWALLAYRSVNRLWRASHRSNCRRLGHLDRVAGFPRQRLWLSAVRPELCLPTSAIPGDCARGPASSRAPCIGS